MTQCQQTNSFWTQLHIRLEGESNKNTEYFLTAFANQLQE